MDGKPGFLKSTLSPGQLLIISGTMRSGKSDRGVKIMEKAVPKGYNVYTNILFFPYEQIDEAIREGVLKQKKEWYRMKPPEIHIVTTASELIKGLCRTKNNFTLLDEAIMFAKGGSGNVNTWFKMLVTQIRKFRSNMGLLVQVASELAPMLREELPSYDIHVEQPDDNDYYRYADIYFVPKGHEVDYDLDKPIDTWEDLKQSRYPYDHEAPAGFTFDIDIREFINRISKLTSVKARRFAPGIIEEMLPKSVLSESEEEALKQKTLITMILKHNPKITTKDIQINLSNLFGINADDSYIRRIRRNNI